MELAPTGRERKRHAVVRVGAALEEKPRQRQVPRHADGAPEYRASHAVVQPRIARVRIATVREQMARAGDESLAACRGAEVEARVAEIEDRRPLAGAAGLSRE